MRNFYSAEKSVDVILKAATSLQTVAGREKFSSVCSNVFHNSVCSSTETLSSMEKQQNSARFLVKSIGSFVLTMKVGQSTKSDNNKTF